MWARRALEGAEEVSADGKVWQPIRAVVPPAAPDASNTDAGARVGAASAAGAGTPAGGAGDDEDEGILLGALEIGYPEPRADAPPREMPGLDLAGPAPSTAPAGGDAPGEQESDEPGDFGPPLELALPPARHRGPAAAEPPAEAAAGASAPSPPRPDARLAPLTAPSDSAPRSMGQPAGRPSLGRSDDSSGSSEARETAASEWASASLSQGDAVPRLSLGQVPSSSANASSAMKALLEGDGGAGLGAGDVPDPTRPVDLSAPLAAPLPKTAKPSTLTAAKAKAAPAPRDRRFQRPSRRIVVFAVAAATLGGLAVAAMKLDLLERVRGEPKIQTLLSSELKAALAGDRFRAFGAAADRLESAVAGRKRAPVVRASAAQMLAAGFALHGGDRAALARAEELLASAAEAPKPPVEVTSARAWLALAKGRPAEADRAVEGAELPAGDRALLAGLSALERRQLAKAIRALTEAIAAEPAPFPSRAAARMSLARAHEARLDDTAAEKAYAAVLKEAPGHVGAALGLARTAPRLSPSGRRKLVEILISEQAAEASRTELGEAHALVSRTARDAGDLAASKAALERALSTDPAGAAAAVVAGDALLAEGRLPEAIARYRLAAAPPPAASKTADLRFAQVALFVEGGQTPAAEAALGELESRLPKDARVMFWRGRIAEQKTPADQAAAERAYRAALERNPRFLPAALQLARLLIGSRRAAEGLAVLRAANASGASGRLALAEALLASGQPGEAARLFRQLIADASSRQLVADAPAIGAARLGLATALEASGDLEAARAELDTLARQGDVPGSRPRLAAILVKLGRREEALAVYEKELAGGAATLATKVAAARLALELGRRDPARTWAESVAEQDPRTPGALLVLAEVRRADGDLGRAVSELRRALAVDSSPQVHLELGRALGVLGRDEDALATLVQARDLPEAALERGRIRLRRGDAETAARELKAATAALPNSADAWFLLGEAEDRLGHASKAEAAWRTAVKLAPDAAEARYRLGRLELERGLATAALPHLRAASASLPAQAAVPWRADLYFQLGFAEKSRGSRPAAAAAFRRYLELAPADAPARAEAANQLRQLD